MKKIVQNTGLIIVFLCVWSVALLAQPIKKEVKVIKPYEATLSDAIKISYMPKLYDTSSLSTEYSYSIHPTRINTEFELRPIKAAKMIGDPLPKLYKSHLKAGFGNYFTPLFELSMHNLRSKESSFGLDLGHISSHGKIKLENNEKVFAGYGDNSVLIYGKKFMKQSILSGNLNVLSKSVYHYGYNPDLDTTLEKDDIHQQFLNVGLNSILESSYTDSAHLNYKVSINYDYFKDKNDNIENGLIIQGNFNKFIEKQDIGIKFEIMHFNTSEGIDSSNNTIIGISPYFARHSSDWRFYVGFNSYFDIRDDETKVHFSPNAQLQFIVVKDILIPYLGITGKYQVNNYKTISLENPFIIPNLHVDNTNHKISPYIGLKGRYNNDIAFNLKASYAIIDDMYFYINDTLNELENQFNVIMDNSEVTNLFGEVTYYYSSKLSFLLKANYYNYKLNNESYAWHKPEFDISLSANYNLRNKILANADVFCMGQRFAKSYEVGNEKRKLAGIVDVNLGLEYRYTKNISIFLNLNNLLSAKYYQYNFYPSQGFNFLAGFTYSL